MSKFSLLLLSLSIIASSEALRLLESHPPPTLSSKTYLWS